MLYVRPVLILLEFFNVCICPSECFQNLTWFHFFHNMLFHSRVKKPCRNTNISSSSNFITCKDPDLNARILHESNGASYVILEAIFNGC